LAKAQAMTDVDRVELDHYLTAAIVFGRSAYHYLETAAKGTGDKAYRTWFGTKEVAIKSDVLIQHFRDLRNSEVHTRRVRLSRHVSLTASAVLRTSVYGEMRVKRARPWYRRSRATLWQDVKEAVMRPLRRWWRYRLGVWGWRRRADLDARVARIRARFRKPTIVTVQEIFFGDPEGLNRPAVVLVDAYLSRWEVIVTEAESTFPHLFA
jgi:hypothetical protein